MGQDNKAFAEITKIASDELDVVTVSRQCCKKFYITAHPGANSGHYSMFDSLGAFLRKNNAGIVTQDVFGACELHADGMEALARTCGEVNWPVTWIEGVGPVRKNLTGTQVYAISGISTQPVHLDGRIIGGVFEDDDAVYCLLGDLRPTDISCSREDQTRATLESIETVLGTIGMDFSNVVRTWFYIDEILSWYTEFNTVRNKFFSERGVFDGVVPASTGVGVANPAGAALVAEVFAVKAKNSHNVGISTVGSPLQCPAIDYKSSFSRAVEVNHPEYRHLLISGTASITSNGKTTNKGNLYKQIDLTMDVVKAIIESREMDWDNIVRGIVYFKDINEKNIFSEYCEANMLPDMPLTMVQADICREDLLFEIEIDALAINKNI